MYKVNISGTVYQRARSATSWFLVNSSVIASRIAANAGKVYITSSEGRIYRLSGNSWVEPAYRFSGSAKDITIDANGKVWIVAMGGDIYTLESNGWVKRSESAGVNIAAGGVSGQNSQVWVTSEPGWVYNWNSGENKWERRAGSNAYDIAVDNKYNTWLTAGGKLFRYDYVRKDWIEFRSTYGIRVAANAKKVVIMDSNAALSEMLY